MNTKDATAGVAGGKKVYSSIPASGGKCKECIWTCEGMSL